jgi:hypothetical protein
METGGGFKTAAKGSEHGRRGLNREPPAVNPSPPKRSLDEIVISFEWLFEADITENAMIPHLPNSSAQTRTSLRSAAILIASHKTIV